MQTQTIGRQKALKEIQDYHEYASNSVIRQQWYTQNLINQSYYRGNQWLDPTILKDMQDIGATPLSINNIEPSINNIVSLQITSSKRVGFEASSENSEHEKIAEHLKYLAYDIQTENDYTTRSSQKFKDCLIGGVGWSHFQYVNGKFEYNNINPNEVYWDPDDRSDKLQCSNFVTRSHYVAAFKLKKMYPEFEKEFEQMVEANSINPSDYSTFSSVAESPIWERSNSIATANVGVNTDGDGWVRGRSIRIVDVYYKKSVRYYETTVIFPENGDGEDIPAEHTFKTFDKKIAKEKSSSGKIVEKKGTQIWHGVFSDNLLISNNPIEAQIPNQKYLPLTPVVLRRDYQGMPYGVVDNLIPLQKTLNYLYSTTLHYLDARTIIGSDEQVDSRKLQEFLKDEMRSKNGVVFIKNPHEMQILDHEKDLSHRMSLIQQIYSAFEMQTGFFDELKGEQTNAISGVAIAQRINSSRNIQNTRGLVYENMLITEGKLMLDTIKGVNDFEASVKYFTQGKNETASLDDTISLLDFEVFPDIKPNFLSGVDETQARFAELINGPNPGLLLSSPLFLREVGFSEHIAYELSEEYLKVTGMAQQPPEQQQGGMPTEEEQLAMEETNGQPQ